MKNIISEKEWMSIKDALMEAQIPYKVSFDAQLTKDATAVYYDIKVEPFVVSIERKIV